MERLLGRYGSAVTDLLAMIARSPELAAPLTGASRHRAAKVVYAVTHEGALDLDDVLSRAHADRDGVPGLRLRRGGRGSRTGRHAPRLARRGPRCGGRRIAVRVAVDLAALAAPDDASAVAMLTV